MSEHLAEGLRVSLLQLTDVTPGGQGHTKTRLGQVNDAESNEECDGGNDFEVEQRLQTHAANFFQVAGAGNAVDQRGENKWRNDRLDEVEENISEEVNVVAPDGLHVTKQTAQHEADQDLRGQRRQIPGTRLCASFKFRVSSFKFHVS